jgi:DNA polymerase-3 subunit delta
MSQSAGAADRILLFYGGDDFSRHEATQRLIAGLGDEAAFNLSRLEGERLAFDELQAAAMTPPFLGSRRLIIVEGLLARFQRAERGRREGSTDLGPWASLPSLLQGLPDTTTLIFSEGAVAASNPLFRLLRPRAAREFRPLRGADLHQWVLERARRLGGQIGDEAGRALIAIAGEDLWVLYGELEKLILFAEGKPVTQEMVHLMASGAREVNVFELANAILAARQGEALRLLHELLEQGVAPALLLFMLARQFRLLLRALDLLGQPPEQARGPLGLNEAWQAERALRQARALGYEGLLAAHQRLLDADLAMKTGRYSAEMALELLVIDLTAGASSIPARSPAR